MKIGFYNHKGGVGKTSLCCHVGFKAIEKGYKLCVYDADRQMNTMSWLSGHRWNQEPYENGSIYVTQYYEESQDYENVIVDCPPAYDIAKTLECDMWVIPVDGRFSIDGCINVITEIKTTSPDSRIVLVVNKAINNKFGKSELKEISKLEVEIFKFPIPSADFIRKSEMMGVPVWKIPYSSRNLATQNIDMFSDWVIDGCKQSGVYMPSEDKNDFNIKRR